jgi:hypothetical protein
MCEILAGIPKSWAIRTSELFGFLTLFESPFLQLTGVGIHKRNLLKARVVVTPYNLHVRLRSPEPWLVGTTKVYSGVGADIVMESISHRGAQSGEQKRRK